MSAKKKTAEPAVKKQAGDEAVKGQEAPNVRKRDMELFDHIRSELAKVLVAELPLVYGHLSDADKWAKAHSEARVIFGWVLDSVARNGAHITKAYPAYLRELIELATAREPERTKELDDKHGISEEVRIADSSESVTASEAVRGELPWAHAGPVQGSAPVPDGGIPGL